jgi:hypothetical protein
MESSKMAVIREHDIAELRKYYLFANAQRAKICFSPTLTTPWDGVHIPRLKRKKPSAGKEEVTCQVDSRDRFCLYWRSFA